MILRLENILLVLSHEIKNIIFYEKNSKLTKISIMFFVCQNFSLQSLFTNLKKKEKKEIKQIKKMWLEYKNKVGQKSTNHFYLYYIWFQEFKIIKISQDYTSLPSVEQNIRLSFIHRIERDQCRQNSLKQITVNNRTAYSNC